MERARIEEEWINYCNIDLAANPLGFARRIAKIARAEALEEAAKMVYNLDFVPATVAKKIRALKEKS